MNFTELLFAKKTKQLAVETKKSKKLLIKYAYKFKKVTLLKKIKAFLLKPKIYGFFKEYWRFTEDIPITLKLSKQLTESQRIVLANHLILAIANIQIAKCLPFKTLPETTIKNILHLFYHLLDNTKKDFISTTILDFVFCNEKSIVKILTKYLKDFCKTNKLIKVKKKRVKRNLRRRSFFKHNKKRKRIVYFQKKYKKKNKQTIYKILKKRNITKIRSGIIYVTLKRRNSFLILAKKVRIKAKQKKKHKTINTKRYLKLYFAASIGRVGYKGRAKSSSIARQTLAQLVLQKAIRKHFHILRVIFLSEIKRLYMPILTGLASKIVAIRIVKRVVLRPHGYVRYKKKRRT